MSGGTYEKRRLITNVKGWREHGISLTCKSKSEVAKHGAMNDVEDPAAGVSGEDRVWKRNVSKISVPHRSS